jgi:NAD dependent epimerase/dehydratase family enzyme
MIGTELRRQLEESGHTVLRLVRGRPTSTSEFNWAPAARMIDFTLMDRADAVINLSGASLNHLPWTPRYKKLILESRLQATHTLTDAMRMASTPPPVFISASAVGYYGDRPGERLTEQSPRGEGFLADVVDAWEHAANLAPEQTRVVTIRTCLSRGSGSRARSAQVGRCGHGSACTTRPRPSVICSRHPWPAQCTSSVRHR